MKSARLLAELTQAQLAPKVGVSRQTIIAIERGDYAPSVYLALKIARELSSKVEQLFHLTDNLSVIPNAAGFDEREKGTATDPAVITDKDWLRTPGKNLHPHIAAHTLNVRARVRRRAVRRTPRGLPAPRVQPAGAESAQ